VAFGIRVNPPHINGEFADARFLMEGSGLVIYFIFAVNGFCRYDRLSLIDFRRKDKSFFFGYIS